MEKILAERLRLGSPYYDGQLYKKLVQVCSQYVQHGLMALNYNLDQFDAANDLMECYAPCTLAEYTARTRMSPRNFIMPMTSTQMTTLATFISQILFGAETNTRVEPRTENDEGAARSMNQLLIWNDNQQDTYRQKYLWILDSLVFNRGVEYERWKEVLEVSLEEIQEEDITAEPEVVMKKDGSGPRLKSNGEPVMKYPKTTRWKKIRKPKGGYTHLDLVAPSDFICDPDFPLRKFQEGRFAGHRIMIPWYQLEERSRLESTDYNYVLPEAVKKLKGQKTDIGTSSLMPQGASKKEPGSRSYFDRTGKQAPQAGIIGATEVVNKEDGGVIECWVVYIKAKPKTYRIYDDDDTELIELLIGGQELLACNIMPNKHDEYPYNPGEVRPSAHCQFGKSWALITKPLQHRFDNLHNRHAEAQRRQGNILVVDDTTCEIADLFDPDKDGLIIRRKEGGQGQPVENLVSQIPTTDTTAKFLEECDWYDQQAEKATGAHAQLQGETENPSQTLGQFETVTKMGTGRISTMARMLSSGALMPQTRRIAMNFQQFAPDEMIIRISGDNDEYDPDKEPVPSIAVRKADIQCEFDYTSSDGALPGMDGRKTAGLTRFLEIATQPAFQQYIDDTVPGNIDIKRIAFETAKGMGLSINDIVVRRATALKNLASRQMAAGGGIVPQTTNPETQGLPPNPEGAPQLNAAPPVSSITPPQAQGMPPPTP